VINACAQAGDAPKALELLSTMEGMGLRPDEITMNSVLKAICRSKRSSFSCQDHFVSTEMRSRGFMPDRFSYFELLLSCTRLHGGETRAASMFDALLADGVDPASPNLLKLLQQSLGAGNYETYCASRTQQFERATKSARQAKGSRVSGQRRHASVAHDSYGSSAGRSRQQHGKGASRAQRWDQKGKGHNGVPARMGKGDGSTFVADKQHISSAGHDRRCDQKGKGHWGATMQKGKGSKGKGTCRYGAHCHRPDCWFEHPS